MISASSSSARGLCTDIMVIELVILLGFGCIITAEIQVHINASDNSPGPVQHFWTSTGLCPPEPRTKTADFLLSNDMYFNFLQLASIPGNGITHVRIHWLLDVVTIKNLENGIPELDMSKLDQLLEVMLENNLYPGFELMGNPSGYFHDLGNATEVVIWYNLIRKITGHYISKYGLETVSQWRFETWNEPDLKSYNVLNFTLSSYLSYWNACSNGIRDAWSDIKVGTPAGLFKNPSHHLLCWGLLNHCNLSRCQLGFISYHKKGGGSSETVVQEGVELIKTIQHQFPTLAQLPFVNDEADPLTGWALDEEWRADARYAAMLARVVLRHHEVMIRQLKLPLGFISSDNSFLSLHPYHFTQRTLLARFQMNNTAPQHVQYIRKPVMGTLTLLSLLGDSELATRISGKDDWLSVLATEFSNGPWSSSILLVYCNDTVEVPGLVTNVSVKLSNIPPGNGTIMYSVYTLNNQLNNPYSVWKNAKEPPFPDFDLRQRMRSIQDPVRMVGPQLMSNTSSVITVNISLTLPSVTLVQLCRQKELGKVTQLKAYNVTFNEVLLVWQDNQVGVSCIKTYEIEYMPHPTLFSQSFSRVNTKDSIMLSFQHVLPQKSGREEVRGIYRVRAVDFWDTPGPYSTPLQYPHPPSVRII